LNLKTLRITKSAEAVNFILVNCFFLSVFKNELFTNADGNITNNNINPFPDKQLILDGRRAKTSLPF